MRRFIIVILCFLLIGCGSKDTSYTSISMKEAIQTMESMENFVLVDVRTEEEYNAGHIPGAICIPNESIENEPIELKDKNQVLFIYCRSGNRSKQAADKLVKLGYTNIYEIGGIMDYEGEIE